MSLNEKGRPERSPAALLTERGSRRRRSERFYCLIELLEGSMRLVEHGVNAFHRRFVMARYVEADRRGHGRNP